MGLVELTEKNEAFFILGAETEGFVSLENSNGLVLGMPIRAFIPGPAMRRFYLGDDQSLLYVEFKSSLTGDLQNFELGRINDLDIAKTWIERVNRLYEHLIT